MAVICIYKKGEAMFNKKEMSSLLLLVKQYDILICNAHDIRMRSTMTGHEWIIISPYDGSACEILHRHSVRYPFHHQRGRYKSLASAMDYIRRHDEWYCGE